MPSGPRAQSHHSWSVGDLAEIGEGPARGLVGEVLTVDDSDRLAQVRVRIGEEPGRCRFGVAVVSLANLHVPGSRSHYTSRPQRGRPRSISAETVEKIARMHETGSYSHAMIAAALGISKTSVANYLRVSRDRRTTPAPRATR